MTEIEAIERGFERLATALTMPRERRLWNVRAVAEYFGYNPAAVYRAILHQPGFPEPIKIEGGCKRWVSGEVMAWAEAQRERHGESPKPAGDDDQVDAWSEAQRERHGDQSNLAANSLAEAL